MKTVYGMLCGLVLTSGACAEKGGDEGADAEVVERADAPPSVRDAAPPDAKDAAPPDVPWARATICNEPQGTFGSCRSAVGVCTEASSLWGTTGTALCSQDLGDFPSDGPCSARGATGRCFDPQGEYWTYFYGDDDEAVSWCQDTGGWYCPQGPGLTEDHVRACAEGCREAQSDFAAAGAPECAQGASCEAECEDHVRDLPIGCARCLAARIEWDAGSCGEWECSCPPPSLMPADAQACADACASQS